MANMKADRQRKAVPLPEGRVKEKAVRRALETYSATVREGAVRPRNDVPERREEERLARFD